MNLQIFFFLPIPIFPLMFVYKYFQILYEIKYYDIKAYKINLLNIYSSGNLVEIHSNASEYPIFLVTEVINTSMGLLALAYNSS